MTKNFACFILSHGRPDRVLTYNSLRKGGYTGPIYIICDNEDKHLTQYKNKYKDEIIVFNKTEYAKKVDACDNYDMRNSIVYARNYNFEIARQLGITHFLQLDDDYTNFGWTLSNNDEYVTANCSTKQLDDIFAAYLSILDSDIFTSIAFAQGGDLIGGADGFLKKYIRGVYSRKVMNSFFFRATDNIVFRGRVNDDVNLYVEGGRRGLVFLTCFRNRLWQPETQQNSGGCTDIYKKLGTYIKSFYSVMVAPSCVKIAMMNTSNKRIHHMVEWNKCCPLIIDEKYKKPQARK